MAMTLRLDEGETDALRRRAALEHRSMQDVARQAVRDYVEQTSRSDLIAPAPPTAAARPPTADANTSAAQHSGPATSPTTSPDHS